MLKMSNHKEVINENNWNKQTQSIDLFLLGRDDQLEKAIDVLLANKYNEH